MDCEVRGDPSSAAIAPLADVGASSKREHSSATCFLRPRRTSTWGNQAATANGARAPEAAFLDETDPMSSPLKAKGVGELASAGFVRQWLVFNTDLRSWAFGTVHRFGGRMVVVLNCAGITCVEDLSFRPRDTICLTTLRL